jgi:hypothetical protein
MASVEGSNLDASYATLFIREHNLESRPASILKDKRRGGSILWIKLVPNVPAAAVAAGLEDTFRSKANKLAADQQFAEAERIIWRGTSAVDAYLREQRFEPREVARISEWEANPGKLEGVLEAIWAGEHLLIVPSNKTVRSDIATIVLSDEAKQLL